MMPRFLLLDAVVAFKVMRNNNKTQRLCARSDYTGFFIDSLLNFFYFFFVVVIALLGC
jgi:hypothetical protein